MAQLKYRPEIDGLRAVAVMAVVLYHAGFIMFGGGYVGVDVFFVISGYLITSLIVREVNETGGFRFGNFYLRRIRRLFPALFCTTLVCWVASFLFISPEQMADFGASALAALTSLSNFYFWFEADYFDSAAITKPLLHTWSLSVEEQFYLIWPAFVVFVLVKLPRSFALALIALLCVASIMIAEHWIATDRAAAFYLLPARMAELAIGAALVGIESERKHPNNLLEFGAFGGLALIAWSIFTYEHETPFPGIASLWPCLGTAMFIYCSKARYAGGLLRFEPAVWIGKISYSLYLVHWPVIVFYTMLVQTEPNVVGKWVMVILSVSLGWLQYHTVENRFRHAQPGRDGKFAGWLTIGATPVLALSLVAYLSGGMTWRIPEHRTDKSDFEWRVVVKETACSSPAPPGTFAAENPDLVTCQNYRGKRNDIYVWGDSHALHLAAGFARNYPAYNVYILYKNGCVPQSGFGGYTRKMDGKATRECVARNRAVLKELAQMNPTNVIITSAKRGHPRKIVKATSEIRGMLANSGHRVAFLGDFVRPGRSIAACRTVPDYVISDQDLDKRCNSLTADSQRELRYNRAMARLDPDFIQVNDLQCAFGACKFSHRGQVLYRDSHHLNPVGSVYFVRKLKPRLPIKKNGKRSAAAAQKSASLSLKE